MPLRQLNKKMIVQSNIQHFFLAKKDFNQIWLACLLCENKGKFSTRNNTIIKDCTLIIYFKVKLNFKKNLNLYLCKMFEFDNIHMFHLGTDEI